ADLASFDPAASEWLADAGIYTINLGASSADIRLSKQFQNPELIRIKP
ncbi:MAG: hypothetical protein HW386_1255, partial [Gammaproteobacteria bacterium]|nr:hypothetical protein [Gammaproteobacteria bacterium]